MRWILTSPKSWARLSLAMLMSIVVWGLEPRLASGQTPAPGEMHASGIRSTGSSIQPPRRFPHSDPAAPRTRMAAEPSPSRMQNGMTAQSLPSALALPDVTKPDVPAPGSEGTATTPSPPARLPIDTALIPGRTVEPIDLANALKLTGARDLDIAITRQRILEAAADLKQARALWLPSLFYGPTWYRADGQIQTVTGTVQTIDRSSLFLGATAALANSFPAPSPGTGFPSLNGLSATLRISDAIFEPMAARRGLAANQAGLRTANNDAMLRIAEAYFDLQAANGRLAIAREAAANAEALSTITGAYARLGEGLEADHHRALTELRHRRKETQLAIGQLLVASANLVRLLVLNPALVFAPVEPPEAIIRLLPDEVSLDDLVLQALRNRPELASARELVEAAMLRVKQARLRPFVPSVALTYAGGGFGGGAGPFFGNFGTRGDAAASLFWDLRNLGFTDVAIMRRRAAEHETANLEKIRTQTRVAADVVASYETRQAAARQIDEAREGLVESLESLRLNFLNIRQGAELPRATRPIEVLQPIQALAQARLDYLDSVLDYNRAQFRLKRAIGQQP
jgi:outer membrane protein TolC